MNGIHDMGGIQGMGAIGYTKSEPTFHADWERRVMAMNAAMQATGRIGAGPRLAIERLPPLDYMQMSYYERWFAALIARIANAELVTAAEIELGRPLSASKDSLAVSPAEALTALHRIPAVRRNVSVDARFQIGQQVRAKNINPVTHTRLPRYARGKSGIVVRDQGVFAFPDSVAKGLGEMPQHVYSVRFVARELWGDEASSRDSVYLDIWDDNLESA